MSADTIIETSDFGTTPDGYAAQLFTLKRNGGLSVSITNFGGIITQLHVPDKEGNYLDVVLGFNSIDDYLKENIYAGAIIGRIAGRVSNCNYTVDGKAYQLTANHAACHLHGGKTGFDKQVWQATIIKQESNDALQLRYYSPDGEEGYLGNVHVTVVYSLTDKDGLRIDFKATTDKATPLCLTSHSYFNLSEKATVLDHLIQIDADYTIEVDEMLLPTGNKNAVKTNSNDFRKSAPLHERLPFLYLHHGDNYLLNNWDGSFKKVAFIRSGDGKRSMEIFTTAPNLQFYTGVGVNTSAPGKKGLPYQPYAGLCFECQGFSDACNHAGFDSIVLQPGSTFEQSTEYRFVAT